MITEFFANLFPLIYKAPLDIVGHLSFILTALSFGVRDMLFLRSLAIASGLVGIAYNVLNFDPPLWLVIFWLSVFICINGYRIIGIILERRSIHFNEEELESSKKSAKYIQEQIISKFPKIDTDKLWEEGSKSNGLTFSHTKESMELSDKILQNNIIQSLINENMNKKDWERARRREQVRVSGTKQRDRSIKT